MTTMMNVIGETGIMYVDGLSFEVKVLEEREVAEGTYYLVKPISGSGEKWVRADAVSFEPLETFLKNVLETEVDAVRNTIRYIVYAQYEVRHQNERTVYYKLGHKAIEDITLTWDEIEQEGGPGEILKQLKECYNV